MRHFIRETSNQSRRSVSLLLWEKGDHEVVDEELVKIQDTSSVSLRLPPSPTGEGLGYAAETPRHIVRCAAFDTNAP